MGTVKLQKKKKKKLNFEIKVGHCNSSDQEPDFHPKVDKSQRTAKKCS